MPRVSFAQEFKSADTDRFPKLKLDKGERSRLWIPGRDGPWMEWYHRIEAPVIEHGEPVMELKDTKRGPVETWKMDWIGNVFCIGETGTPESPGPLMLAGIDPANCPACESAANKTGVAAPQQRFALPVIKFKVKGRGNSPYDLASPISAEVRLWAYTARIHGMLHELESEHGDLHRHDLKLELEDTPGADTYQKIKQLAVIVKPAYTDPKVREYLRDLWGNEENRPNDDQLRDACLGRDVPRLVMMDMVRRAERQYKQAEQAGGGGGDTAAADGAFNGDLASGVDALLDTTPADPWAADAAPAGDPLDEFMTGDPTDGDIDQLPPGDDPFADETPAAPDATTTGTAAPAAEPSSRTEPKSAASAPASDPDMLDDLESQTAVATKANGRKKAGTKAEAKTAAEQPDLTPPEPAKAAAGSGVVDFDDLFSD